MSSLSRSVSLLLSAVLALGCAVTRAPASTRPLAPAAATADWTTHLRTPGPITIESAVSARWSVPAAGLIDRDDPAAAHLTDEKVPIVLPVHLLHHPEAGVLTVDTGIDARLAEGDRGPLRGLVRAATGTMEPVASLSELLDGAVPSHVLLTHAHLDHVLGLPDVPVDVPVITGPGELGARDASHVLLKRTYGQLFADREALQVLDPADAEPFGPISHAWDLLGDGTVYALWMPGHTPGSLAYLARTTEGPVLFAGDTCHTLWGWEHNVAPGRFTADAEGNRQSLDALQQLSDALPELVVHVGHELDGHGTGFGDGVSIAHP